MQYFLLGLVALALGLLLLHGFTRANAGVLARQIRVGVGLVALVAAAALLIRGMVSLAMPLAAFGLWLVWGRALPGGGRPQKSPGQTSRAGGSPTSRPPEMPPSRAT